MKSINKFWAALGIAALLASSGAQAETVRIKETGTVTGESVNVRLPVGTDSFYLGVVNIKESSGASFLAYCVDPFQYTSGSYTSYNKSVLGLGQFSSNAQTRLNNVTELFGYAYAGSLTSANKAAGFQLALWEVYNDDLNLNSGFVEKTRRTDEEVLEEAQALLSSLKNHRWKAPAASYQMTVFTSATRQDLISVSAVPEPETYALVLVGLSLVGWAARRRQQV